MAYKRVKHGRILQLAKENAAVLADGARLLPWRMARDPPTCATPLPQLPPIKIDEQCNLLTLRRTSPAGRRGSSLLRFKANTSFAFNLVATLSLGSLTHQRLIQPTHTKHSFFPAEILSFLLLLKATPFYCVKGRLFE